jgi:hypothetical protein
MNTLSLDWHMVPQVSHAIALVDKYQFGFVGGGLVCGNLNERSQNDQIAHARPTGCGAIEGDDSRATCRANGVGHKALTVCDVPDMELFVLADARGIE